MATKMIVSKVILEIEVHIPEFHLIAEDQDEYKLELFQAENEQIMESVAEAIEDGDWINTKNAIYLRPEKIVTDNGHMEVIENNNQLDVFELFEEKLIRA